MTLHLIKPTILHIRLHNLIIWRESLQTSIIQKLATQEDTNLYPLVILRSVWMPFIKQPMPSLVNRTRKLPNGGIAKPGSCYRESPQQHCPRTLDLSFPATSPSSSSAVFIVILQEVPKRNPLSDLQLAVEEQTIWGFWSPFPNLEEVTAAPQMNRWHKEGRTQWCQADGRYGRGEAEKVL